MLKQRIITGLVLAIPAVAIVILAPAYWFSIVLAALLILAAWEWSALLPILSQKHRLIYVLALTALGVIIYFSRDQFTTTTLLILGSLWWFAAWIMILVYPKHLPTWLVAAAGVIILLSTFSGLVWLRELNRFWLICIFLIVWGADVGAYFGGKYLGQHQLAPRVSPKKTWEGLIFGTLTAAGLSVVMSYYLSLPTTLFIVFSVVVAWLSVVGDLTISRLKRRVGVKDSGKIFPGHGGVLDRIDSLAAAAPIFVLGAIFFTGKV